MRCFGRLQKNHSKGFDHPVSFAVPMSFESPSDETAGIRRSTYSRIKRTGSAEAVKVSETFKIRSCFLFPCCLSGSLSHDQSILIQRYDFHRAFRLLLSFFINGESVITFELPGSLALLRAIGRPGSGFDQAAVGFQGHGGSAAGAGKRKGGGSKYRFRRGVFLMRMHPMLVQGIPVNVLLHRCSCVRARLTTTCRSSCADHSGLPASAPPAAW